MFTRFATIHERDRQTDGRTDGHARRHRHRPRLCRASRGSKSKQKYVFSCVVVVIIATIDCFARRPWTSRRTRLICIINLSDRVYGHDRWRWCWTKIEQLATARATRELRQNDIHDEDDDDKFVVSLCLAVVVITIIIVIIICYTSMIISSTVGIRSQKVSEQQWSQHFNNSFVILVWDSGLCFKLVYILLRLYLSSRYFLHQPWQLLFFLSSAYVVFFKVLFLVFTLHHIQGVSEKVASLKLFGIFSLRLSLFK